MRFFNVTSLKGARRYLFPTGTKRTVYSFFSTVESTSNANGFQQKDIQFKTLYELQKTACDVYSINPIYGTYNETTCKFEYLNYEDFGSKVNECCLLLKDLGVKQFDKIGIISNNRYEWAMIAAATYSLNATLVPMYEAQLATDWKYIINDSSASVIICSTKDIFHRFSNEVLHMTPSVHSTLCLDAVDGEEYGYQTAMSEIIDNSLPPEQSSIVTTPNEEDLANLIYTSGTTGNPKGVELTHRNIVSNIKGGRLLSQKPHDLLDESSKTLAFLPWAHSYGQTVELWMAMSFGSSCAICRGIPFLLEDLQLVKPTVIFAVPTLYSKVYDSVQNKANSGQYIQDALLRNAIEIGNKNAQFRRGERDALSFAQTLKYTVLDRLVLSKIRDRFGGNLRYGCVAGAACPIDVLKFMDSIGIPVLEGYGLTETSPIISLNSISKRSIGSVGRPLQGVEVYIIDNDGKVLPPGKEGEICCVGPNVMRGYYNNKEATDEVISVAPDGKSRMFHTGDLGRMDADGWIKVTGRIKEQYKLENGKYVAPAPIENAIGLSRFINQVVICGANKPYNVALIVPDWPAISQKLEYNDEIPESEIANKKQVHILIDNEIRKCCSDLKKFEIPRKWAFVAPFTAANNMVTPKMSIRKHKVLETYSDLIANLYRNDTADSNHADDQYTFDEAA
eukprot:jgi/Psemu1/264815/estExt_Genewise1Plus.C_23960001